MFVIDKRGILSSFMMYQYPNFRAKLKLEIWWKSWVYEKICDKPAQIYTRNNCPNNESLLVHTQDKKILRTKITAFISDELIIMTVIFSPKIAQKYNIFSVIYPIQSHFVKSGIVCLFKSIFSLFNRLLFMSLATRKTWMSKIGECQNQKTRRQIVRKLSVFSQIYKCILKTGLLVTLSV